MPVILDEEWGVTQRSRFWMRFEIAVGCTKECGNVSCRSGRRAYRSWESKTNDIRRSRSSVSGITVGIYPTLEFAAAGFLDYPSLGECNVPGGVAASPFLRGVMLKPPDKNSYFGQRRECHPWYKRDGAPVVFQQNQGVHPPAIESFPKLVERERDRGEDVVDNAKKASGLPESLPPSPPPWRIETDPRYDESLQLGIEAGSKLRRRIVQAERVRL